MRRAALAARLLFALCSQLLPELALGRRAGQTGLRRGAPACSLPGHTSYPFCDTGLSIDERVRDLVGRIKFEDKPNLLMARGANQFTRPDGDKMQPLPYLGVPEYYWGTNCLHSVLNLVNDTGCISPGKCPASFPANTGFAATFDRATISAMAGTIGRELRSLYNARLAYGLDCWGPVINLNRDPRWGRNGEGGSEDPVLTAALATAWTTGLQNSSADPHRIQVAVTLKHMAANSLESTIGWSAEEAAGSFTRHNISVNVSNFTLSDAYFPGFRAAIKHAGAKGIMCSYNAVNEVPTCLSPLMREARERWGFSGYVTSDSDSVADAWRSHHYQNQTEAEATADALNLGQCDIDSGSTYFEAIVPAMQQGLLTNESIDRALFNSMRVRFQMGLFDPVSSQPLAKLMPEDVLGSAATTALNLKGALQSLVLLHNGANPKTKELVLPLKPGQTIAVIGPHAKAQRSLIQTDTQAVCDINGNFDCLVTPFEAISNLNIGGVTHTARGCDSVNASTAGFSEAIAVAKLADVIVFAGGIRSCGGSQPGLTPGKPPPVPDPDFSSCHGYHTTYIDGDQHLEAEAHDRRSIDLPMAQHQLLDQMLKLQKPIVIVLLNGGAVAIAEEMAAAKAGAPLAVVEAFYPGARGAEAIALSLFGKENRWGRMPYTVYDKDWVNRTKMTQHDLTADEGRTYRYYPQSAASPPPIFEFGSGLSLTHFETAADPTPASCSFPSDLRSNAAEASGCRVEVTAKNTGALKGDVVIAAYLKLKAVPSQVESKMKKQLFDFVRLNDVLPGQTQRATFHITPAALSVSDVRNGNIISAAGTYELSFEDGSGDSDTVQVTITGHDTVLSVFPA